MRLGSLVGLSLLLAPSAYAKPNLKLGAMELHPYYGITGTYDDNIYLVNRDKANGSRTGCLPANAGACSGGVLGSWIMNNNLGMLVGLPVGNHSLMAGYDFSAINYRVQPKANNAIQQSANGLYEFKGSMLNAKLWDNYLNTQDPAFNPNNQAFAGELVARQRRWQNVVGAYIEYALGDKFYFGAEGSHTRHKYLTSGISTNLNRYEAMGGFRTGYKVAPKTKLYISGRRQLVHYNANRQTADHRDWMASVGVEGELSPKVTGKFETGFQHRRYDFDVQRSTPQHSNTSRHLEVSLQLNYKPTERCSFEVGANRSVNEAVTGGRYYVSTGVNFKASHEFFGKLTMAFNGAYQTDKYSEAVALPDADGLTYKAQRRDDVYGTGLKLEYKIQDWLVASTAYQHTRRHSIFTEQFNYRNNKTSLGLKAAF